MPKSEILHIFSWLTKKKSHTWELLVLSDSTIFLFFNSFSLIFVEKIQKKSNKVSKVEVLIVDVLKYQLCTKVGLEMD
jgi:hypothetical protein